MRKRQLALIAGLLFGLCLSVTAQNTKLRKAQRHMEALNYQAAVDIYEELAEKKDLAIAKINIAEAYRKLNDYRNAEYWYQQVVQLPEAQAIHRYYLGLMMQRNGKCDEAQDWYNRFLQLKPYDVRKPHLQNACAYYNELMTRAANDYEVEHLAINSPFDDLGAAFYHDGIVFGSFRSNGDAVTSKQKYLDLFFTRMVPDSLGDGVHYAEPQRFAPQLNTGVHEAIVTFSGNEDEIFFTRNRPIEDEFNDKPLVRLEILHAYQTADGNWSNPAPLPFNSDNYSVAHPSLSPDGLRLFFASDMPGGFGGKDLYISVRDSSHWGPPINLGPNINTEGDELFPFYDPGHGLYFASDGHFGLGGQDIYFAAENAGNEWSVAENLGAPINSTFDDFGLILTEDGSHGYFTSNREGGAGEDDLYFFKQLKKQPIPAFVQIMDGSNGTPLANAAIASSCEEKSMASDANGQYKVVLENNHCCTLRIDAQGYEPAEATLCAGQQLEIRLNKKAATPVETQRTLQGLAADKVTRQPLAGVTIRITSESCGPVDVFTTNANGEFSLPLSSQCCYSLRAEKAGYFAKVLGDTICPANWGEAHQLPLEIFLQSFVAAPVAATPGIVTPTTQESTDFAMGIRTNENDEAIPFLLNLYYDFGRSSVNGTSVPELFKLLQLLNDNPNLVLEISSHTDSRGSNSFNMQLSQRRADAIVAWLVSKGIPSDRLVPKGYGESKPVNHCVDGVACTEEEYQLNRRTEFRVLKQLE